MKSRKGEYFRAWVATLEALGFKAKWRVVNSADFGAATTRARFFLMARSDGRPIRWPEATHARSGAPDLVAGVRPMWRPAREIIDWSIKGRSIFTRRTPLASKTIARIYAGALKFEWGAPFLVILRQHMSARGLDLPLPTITASRTHIGLVEPFVLPQGSNSTARPCDEPVPTVVSIARIGLCEPFVLSRHAGGAPRSIDEPTPSQTAKQSHLLVEPLISPYYGSGSGATCRSVAEPLPSVTTKGRFGIVMPITGSNRARDLDQPLATITTAARGELAFIAAAFGEREGQAPRPSPTICAAGRVNLVEGVQPIEPGRDFDILFRMLEPSELAAAMGFDASYTFGGTKTEIIRQIGNAVEVNTAAALVAALLEDAR